MDRLKRMAGLSRAFPSTKLQSQVFVIIIVLSILLRVGSAFFLGDQVVDMPGTADQISYHNLALRVMNGFGFSFGQDWWPATPANAPTAHWSFIYTFFLVIVYSIFGPHPLAARLIQAILVGLFQPLFAYLIGKKIFNTSVGLASAAITALYAYFIYYAGALMTESFYITAILAGLFLAMQITDGSLSSTSLPRASTRTWRGIALGVCLGLAVLLRQLFLLFIPFLFIWILWSKHKLGERFPIRELFLAGIAIVAMILPFTIFNSLRFGHFVLLNTNAGFAFFWGNNPVYGTRFVPLLPDYHALIPKNLLSLDEAALDQALLRLGIQFVIADPVRYILLSISRIPVYFMFWPSGDSGLVSNVARVASFGILWPFMLYGLVRSISFPSDRPREKSLFLQLSFLFLAIYTLIHLASWALVRYRLPVDAVLIPFAALAFLDLQKKLASLRTWNRAGSITS